MEPLDGSEIVYKLGQKFRSDVQAPTETTMTTMYLTAGEYDILSWLEGPDLVKLRYSYPIDGREFGVDVFQGLLDGLVLAEMEALTPESLSQIEPPDPDWLEVTEETFFTGGSLASLTRESFLAGMHGFKLLRLKSSL
jgi:CYTH domain-containing protein